VAKLKIKGRVSYIPGPWGLNVRGKQLPVKIIDIHPVKATRQIIWEGKTNDNGDFSGTTKDWRDIVTVPSVVPGVPPTRMPDPTDLLWLVIQVKEGGKWHEYPFIFVADNIQAPTVLPFPPDGWNPNNDRATLNGADITDLQALSDVLFKAIQSRQPKITLKLYGNWASSAKPIVDRIREIPLKRFQRVFPNAKAGSITISIGTGITITLTAAAILASASLVLAIGAAILMSGAAIMVVLLGIAVIIALLMGYASIKAEQKTLTNPDGTTTNEVSVEFSLN
jgi:hypothetical protein